MYALVYHSTANLDLTAKDISNILETSRYWNKKNGVSGSFEPAPAIVSKLGNK